MVDSSEDAVFGSSLPSNFDVVPSNDLGEYVPDDLQTNTWPCYLWEGLEGQGGFVGREDTFKAIDDCFFKPADPETMDASLDAEKLPCCCISGLGGMGKTQTAIQYAFARRNKFDAVFVIQADTSAKLSAKLHKIAPALGLSDGEEKRADAAEEMDLADLVVNRNKAWRWLLSPKFSASALAQRTSALGDMSAREPNWLLIFDNVENSSILRDYLPVGKVGCILVTTRDARTSDYLSLQSRVTHIYLDKLNPNPASELLIRLSFTHPSKASIQDALDVVDKLGGLPLAIEQVAAYIHDKRMALKEFLALYNKTLQDRRQSDGGHAWSYEIATTWQLDSLSAMADSLLRVYSFLDPDDIRDSLLTESLVKQDVNHLPPEYPHDQMLHIDARGELLKSSLVRVDMNTTPVRVRMHRLVQDISLTRMTDSQRVQVFAFAAGVIFKAWPFTQNNWDHQASVWSDQEIILQHIFRLSHIAKAYDVSDLELSIRHKFITLLSSGGW